MSSAGSLPSKAQERLNELRARVLARGLATKEQAVQASEAPGKGMEEKMEEVGQDEEEQEEEGEESDESHSDHLVGSKTCPACGKELPLGAFHEQAPRVNGMGVSMCLFWRHACGCVLVRWACGFSASMYVFQGFFRSACHRS